MICQVPGSSSNLGPGFDCLGIAWKLYDRISFEAADTLTVTGCEARFRGPDNLAYVSFAAAFAAKNLPVPGIHIGFLQSDIPVSRGLGSSAALIAAGAAAANALFHLGFSKEELLDLCTRIEGHPDNLAPSIFGGFTAAVCEDGRAVAARCSLHSSLRFLAVIPDFELSTAAARSVLPNTFSRQDAVFNLSRTALLMNALEHGSMDLIRFSLRDRIHQPYRLPLIAGADRVFAVTEEVGEGHAAACISGAGSTMLIIADSPAVTEKLCRALQETFPAWKILPLEADPAGLQVSG